MTHHDNDEKNVFLNFLAGMGLGALLGAAAALMLAPKSGEETRQDLKHISDDFRGKARKVIDDLSQSSEELVKKSREIIETTKGKVQTAVESTRQSAQAQATEVEESITEESI